MCPSFEGWPQPGFTWLRRHLFSFFWGFPVSTPLFLITPEPQALFWGKKVLGALGFFFFCLFWQKWGVSLGFSFLRKTQTHSDFWGDHFLPLAKSGGGDWGPPDPSFWGNFFLFFPLFALRAKNTGGSLVPSAPGCGKHFLKVLAVGTFCLLVFLPTGKGQKAMPFGLRCNLVTA